MSRTALGFTLIELLVVLALIAVIAGIVMPIVTASIQRGQEAALKEDLYVMRKAIDDYYADKGRYPETLQQLVDQRYLRHIPKDPFTERSDTWTLVMANGDGAESGIRDIHSGSESKDSGGMAYAQW